MNENQNQRNVLVCVTKQKTCETLIKKGYEIRGKLEDSELYVLHVTKNHLIANEENISYLFEISTKYDANMALIFNNSFLSSIKEFVKKNNIKHIVLGETRQNNISESTMYKIKHSFAKFVDVTVVPIQENSEYEDVI